MSPAGGGADRPPHPASTETDSDRSGRGPGPRAPSRGQAGEGRSHHIGSERTTVALPTPQAVPAAAQTYHVPVPCWHPPVAGGAHDCPSPSCRRASSTARCSCASTCSSASRAPPSRRSSTSSASRHRSPTTRTSGCGQGSTDFDPAEVSRPAPRSPCGAHGADAEHDPPRLDRRRAAPCVRSCSRCSTGSCSATAPGASGSRASTSAPCSSSGARSSRSGRGSMHEHPRRDGRPLAGARRRHARVRRPQPAADVPGPAAGPVGPQRAGRRSRRSTTGAGGRSRPRPRPTPRSSATSRRSVRRARRRRRPGRG